MFLFRYYCRARLEPPYDKISEISDTSFVVPQIQYRPDLPKISITNDRKLITAISNAEPKVSSTIWQIHIHANISSQNVPSKPTDAGLILVYNLESDGSLATESIRKDLSGSNPEMIKYRSCVHKKRCRLVLSVTSVNEVGRSDVNMVDIFDLGFIKSW